MVLWQLSSAWQFICIFVHILQILKLFETMSFTSKPLPKPTRNPITTDPISPEPNKPQDMQTLGSIGKIDNRTGSNDLKTNQKSEKPKGTEHPKGNILHVSNICPKLTYEQIKRKLYELFSIYGPIFEIIIKTKDNGSHFAFVDYPNINDAEKAWKAFKEQPKRLQNKPLMVNYCEDPKKNDDRKDQKCYLCHGTGHKAIKCPVKPEMIKKKPPIRKQEDNCSESDQTNIGEPPLKNIKMEPIVPQQSEKSSSSSSSSEETERDPDYLRFLRLKKKILQRKLNKKVKKSKKKRS